jgi:hypothetical protein
MGPQTSVAAFPRTPPSIPVDQTDPVPPARGAMNTTAGSKCSPAPDWAEYRPHDSDNELN